MNRSKRFPGAGLGVCLCLAAAVAPRTSHAAHEGDPVAAEALFKTALGLLERGDWTGACSKLQASQDLDPAVSTLIKLSNALGVEAQELLAGLKWKPGELQPGAFEIKSNAEIQKAENPNSNHPHALSLQK